MSGTAIHGYRLEITVVCCWNLRDSSTALHDQDPYVRLEYANMNVRTQVCKRQKKEPIFNQKFFFVLSEGCREVGVAVWNKNTMERDYLIGTTRVPLTTVLLNGADAGWWPLQYENRPAGQIQLVMNKLRVQRNVLGYNPPVPVDLHSPREAAVPYMAYPPSSYPITSQPLPSSIPQPVLFPSTESRSVSFAIPQPLPSPTRPQPPLLVSSTKESIPFSPSAPSAPEEEFSFNPPPPPPLMPLPSIPHTSPATDLQNHPVPVSPSPYGSTRYQEERVPSSAVPAVEEEGSRRTEVEQAQPSLNQPLVQSTPPPPPSSRPQKSANTLRQRTPKNTTTAGESYSTAATNRSSSKAPTPSGKVYLYGFVFCFLFLLCLDVGRPFPIRSWVGL